MLCLCFHNDVYLLREITFDVSLANYLFRDCYDYKQSTKILKLLVVA